MKYQVGDIIRCYGIYARIAVAKQDHVIADAENDEEELDQFVVAFNDIEGHWRPAETYDRTEFLRLLAQARDAISIEATNLDNNPLLSNAHDAIDHCLMRHAEAKHSGPTDTEILDWLVANDYDGDGIREEVTRAIKAERGKAK